MAESTLERGSEGSEVVELQQSLIELRLKPGEVDGSFGVLTESALKMFQASANIEADGIYGPTSRETLAAVIAQGGEDGAAEEGGS